MQSTLQYYNSCGWFPTVQLQGCFINLSQKILNTRKPEKMIMWICDYTYAHLGSAAPQSAQTRLSF